MGSCKKSWTTDGDVAGKWKMAPMKLVMWTSEAMMPLTSWREETERYFPCVSGEHRVESAEGDISAEHMLVQVISEVGWRV